MLFGEHAVLHGNQAIVCAIDKRVTVQMEYRHDDKIIINSPTLGRHETTLETLVVQKPFQFVLAAIEFFKPRLTCGLNLTIQSDCDSRFGFGSSAAVTVATTAILLRGMTGHFDKETCFFNSRYIVRQVQGCGSGADVAASLYGGSVLYRQTPFSIEPLNILPPLTLIYSGAKTPTPQVVEFVDAQERQFPEVFQQIFHCIQIITESAVKAIHEKKWEKVGKLMRIHQGLQEAMSVNNAKIHDIISILKKHTGVFGEKISGSGLGDCVVALGAVPDKLFPINETQKIAGVEQFPAKMSSQGLQFHE